MRPAVRYTLLSLTGVCVGLLGYEAGCRRLWVGSAEFRVRVLAPVSVRGASCPGGSFRTEEQAIRFRDSIEFSLSPSRLPDPLSQLDSNTFRSSVQTTGSQSPFGVFSDTFNHARYEVVWIELDNAELWVAVLKLPNLRQERNPLLFVTIPADARLVAQGKR